MLYGMTHIKIIVNLWINVTNSRVVNLGSYLMEAEIIIDQFTHGFLSW